ncbi:MIP/aquaporin family protein [Cellulosimicrobium cellulans]|uniref:MIP/aquaporin family protein n=1 Tax=Cellulosimicrobium cellulans TaxID=1710 RepID=UPI001F07092D|nr:aquaporin [Cellulosimicrobium cellulans]
MSQDTTAPGAPEGTVDDSRTAPTEAVAVVQPSLLARLGAEVFGTFFLVLAIVGVAMWVRFFNGNLVLAVALAGGLALVAGIAAVGHVSGGHFNPAVTLGAAIGGRTAWRDVLPYWLAQLVGALLAGVVLLATIPRATLDILQQNQLLDEATTGALFRATANGYEAHSPIVGTFGGAAQQLGLEVTLPLLGALLIEAIGTAVFVGVILGVTDSRTRSTVAPIAIGFALAVLILVAAPFTNASLNPARSTVSAVFGGDWALSQLWVFWVAPLLGGAIAGLFYRAFAFAPKQDDLLGEDHVTVTEAEAPAYSAAAGAAGTGAAAGAGAVAGAGAAAVVEEEVVVTDENGDVVAVEEVEEVVAADEPEASGTEDTPGTDEAPKA